MKKNPVLFFSVCAVFMCLAACQGDVIQPTCPVSAKGDTAVFVYKQLTALFESCTSKLQGTVTEINDSRCPIGAVCFTKGTLFATLEMDSQFSLRLEQDKQIDATYKGSRYSFTLVDATPFPAVNANPGPGDRKAIILIIKR